MSERTHNEGFEIWNDITGERKRNVVSIDLRGLLGTGW